ncbi:alpha-ketoglutarate-dependent taurine dioxygenase [Bradyrhizobium sp. USDA 4369]
MTRTLEDGTNIPVLEWDRGQGVSAWLSSHRHVVETILVSSGAVLLRAALNRAEDLAEISAALGYRRAEFDEESSPRSRVSGDVFTSTDYPASYPIQMHNEYSYASAWPLRIIFGCLQPAAQGGETPIADMRQVLGLLDPELVDRFRRKKVLYRRNYTSGIGIDWRTAFGTTDREVVESYCARNGIHAIWTAKDGLCTEQIGDAVLIHPVTGDEVWFNHAFFFNVRSLEPKALREFLLQEDESDLSTQTFYGDGSSIGADTIEQIRTAMARCTLAWPWQTGDVLIADNMLMAHGRGAYAGPRRIVVLMANAISRAEVMARSIDRQRR